MSALNSRVQEFLSQSARGDDSGNYRRNLESTLTQWRSWLDGRTREFHDVDDVRPKDIARWANHLARRVETDDGIAASTAWTYYSNVSAFLAWCVKWEYIETNPAQTGVVERAMPDKPSGSSGEQQFWTDFDRTLLTRYVDKRAHDAIDDRGSDAIPEVRDRALVNLVAYTGVRGAEVFADSNDPRRNGLRWRDVNLDDGRLEVLGKDQDREDVQLPRQARPALERMRDVLDPAGIDWPVVPSLHAPTLYRALDEAGADVGDDETALEACRRGGVAPPALSVTGARGRLKTLCSEEHADITPDGEHDYLTLHGARRGVGETLYRERGAAAAQRALRHADPATTSEMYSHIEASELAEDVSDVFDGA